MLDAWLARWDRRLARRIGPPMPVRPMALGLDLAFTGSDGEGLSGFIERAEQATVAANSFYGRPPPAAYSLDRAGWLSFASGIETGNAVADTVWAMVQRGHRPKAVIIIRHWSAPDEAYGDLAAALLAFGFTVVRVTLPHHGRRLAPGLDAGEFLSANLGKTIRAVRQSVIDLRCVIDWLEGEGYRRIAVLGASLGSCVAGIAGALDDRVGAVGLLLTAGDFAEVVWTGSATSHIRRALEPAITLDQLRAAWRPISLDSFVPHFRARGIPLHIVSARMDTVMLPTITQRFVDQLRQGGVTLAHIELPCGHHTMGAFPFNLMALGSLSRTLSQV